MIDFHCHLDLYNDPKLAVEDADRAGIYVLSVTTTPKAWRRTLALAQGRKRIRTALGIHPEIAHERLGELPLFEALASETRYFGEVGLDGGPTVRQYAAQQTQVFEFVLATATKQGGKVLTIHSRRAADEVLQLLRRFPAAGTPVLHWFTGTPAQLRRAVEQGCWFSVGPAMLRSERGSALTALIPRDRILTDTDGPFAKVGSRPLQPNDAWSAVEGLAALWKVPLDEVVATLGQNLRRLSGDAGVDAIAIRQPSPSR